MKLSYSYVAACLIAVSTSLVGAATEPPAILCKTGSDLTGSCLLKADCVSGKISVPSRESDPEPKCPDDVQCCITEQDFPDLNRSSPYWEDVQLVAAHGIMRGYPGGEFRGDNELLRQEAAVALVKTFVLPISEAYGGKFGDVDSNHWAFREIEALSSSGLTVGCQNPGEPPKFCPDKVLSRVEFAIFLVKGLNFKAAGTITVPEGASMHDYLKIAVEKGWLDACNNNSLCPDDPMNRFDTARALLAVLSHAKASDKPRPRLRILQLGDSYSAGNGARDPDGDEEWSLPTGCFRSKWNWGGYFVRSLEDVWNVEDYHNVACQGAVTANFDGTCGGDINEKYSEGQTLYDGVFYQKASTVDKVSGKCPTPTDYLYYQDGKKLDDIDDDECVEVVKPQICHVNEGYDIVLLTIGGNDALFAKIIEFCFITNNEEECEKVQNEVNKMLGGTDLKDKIMNVLRLVRDKLKPEALIIYSSYPNLVLDPGTRLGLNDRQRAAVWTRAKGKVLDALQADIVTELNKDSDKARIVYFDGTKDIFSGHELTGSPYFVNRDRWIVNEVDVLGRYVIKEVYHPNPIGHQKWGEGLSKFLTLDTVFGTPKDDWKDKALDMVWVIDATGSMSSIISQVRNQLFDLLDVVIESTSAYRIAIVIYRDPETQVVTTFTNDKTKLQDGLNSIQATGGGDYAEYVYSGIMEALNLDWNSGWTKVMMVIGDAPPKLDISGAEPGTGITANDLISKSIDIDPVQVFAFEGGGLDNGSYLTEISDRTGGKVISASNVVETMTKIIDEVAIQPFAWIGRLYVGEIGEDFILDASGSYDPANATIVSYEWDLDNDGIFDEITTSPTLAVNYDTEHRGYVAMKITTNDGRTSLDSAQVIVNELGYVEQSKGDCALDEKGFSIVFYEKGPLLCHATNPYLAAVEEQAEAAATLDELKAATDLKKTRVFWEMYLEVKASLADGDPDTVCETLNEIIALATKNVQEDGKQPCHPSVRGGMYLRSRSLSSKGSKSMKSKGSMMKKGGKSKRDNFFAMMKVKKNMRMMKKKKDKRCRSDSNLVSDDEAQRIIDTAESVISGVGCKSPA